MINYRCPKCNSVMFCMSTASIPPITRYDCYSCGYSSKPIKEELVCDVLPVEFQQDPVANSDGASNKEVNVIVEPQQDTSLDKVKAIIDEYYINVEDKLKNSTFLKAYFFDKILDVFANED